LRSAWIGPILGIVMSGPPPQYAGDSVAIKTRWAPLVAGGTSFRTRRLVSVNPGRVEFPASLGAKLFAGVFGLMGLSSVVLGIANLHWFPLLFGVGFVGLGGGLFYFGTTPVVFDRREGKFWRGRATPYGLINRMAPAQQARLDDIHALQIITERIRGDDGSYDSYELNLVLRDGRRLNVMDHGDYHALQADAETLGGFLGRPVWDPVAARDAPDAGPG
jgi:hypothetical protein